MAALGTIGTVISAVTGVFGTIVGAQASAAQAAAAEAAGRAQQRAADYEAAQLDIRAKEEQAAAQVEAQEMLRRRALALSQLQSQAAASGFSATDPTVLNLGDEIARYGTVQEQMAQYGGSSRRAGVEGQAAVRRFEGAAARQAGALEARAHRAKGLATIIGGFSSLASRFAAPSQRASGYHYDYFG